MFVELGTTRFDITTRALVMGILNRTPDSFFDGGQYWAFDEFLRKAEQLVVEGADFLDVGGSKAGPGPEVTVQEEIDRVVPAVEALRQRFDLPISVDTFRASVFEESCKVGANIGNDISGFSDPDFLPVAARYDASVVATHVRIGPRMPDPEPIYPDGVRADVVRFLERRSDLALSAGIKRERIMIDAGLVNDRSPGGSPRGIALLGSPGRGPSPRPGSPVRLHSPQPRRPLSGLNLSLEGRGAHSATSEFASNVAPRQLL